MVKKMKLNSVAVCFMTVLLSFSAKAQVDQQMMDASAEQAQGNYAPMNMGYAGFSSIGMTQEAWLDPMQNLGEGQTKPAYSKYYWSPDLILPIRVREGMITMLNFPKWELIEDIFLGDSATFDGQISGPSTLLLYPKKGANIGVDTNIIVFGRSGNRYVFYIRSEGVNTERLTNAIIDIDVVDEFVPEEYRSTSTPYASGSGGGFKTGGGNISTHTRRFQKSDWLKSIPVDPSDFKFDLEVYVPNPDDVVIAPERVWRDNIFTYIDLGKKALNMVQRPIVSMIVERVEVPVGFRTKGQDNRLIIVEGIGDLVLRNGKRLICIKMRRSDAVGLEQAVDSADYLPPTWEVSPPLPNISSGRMPSNIVPATNYNPQGQFDIQVGQSQIIVPEYAKSTNVPNSNVADNIDYTKMQRLNTSVSNNVNIAPQYSYGAGFKDIDNSTISIELGVDSDVSNLESLWNKLSSKYSEELGSYSPFFSVDAPADGQGKELFHLRVGPMKSLEAGDKICGNLGRNGVFCSVVRTQ